MGLLPSAAVWLPDRGDTNHEGSEIVSSIAAAMRRLRTADSGLGLVEILVAMFLLALVAVAFLPLLISSLQLSIRNATVSTATQILNSELDALVATPATCADVTAFGAAATTSTSDRRGVTYRPVRTVPSCSSTPAANYPTTITVRLSVQLTNTTVPTQTTTTSFLLVGPS